MRKTYLKPRVHVRRNSVRVWHSNEDLVPIRVIPMTHNLVVMIIELDMVVVFPILREPLIISAWCAVLRQNDVASESKKHCHTGSQRVFMSSPPTYAMNTVAIIANVAKPTRF